MQRLSRFAIAAITSTAVLLLLTYGAYSLGFWADGHRYTREFIVRSSILLPLLLGMGAAFWPSPSLNRSAAVAAVSGMAFGVVYGYVASRVVFFMAFHSTFGGWGNLRQSLTQMNWSTDCAAFASAGAAGACAMLLSIASRSRQVLLTVAALLAIALLVPRPAFDHITHNQELTVAIVTLNGVGAPSSPVLQEQVTMPRINVAGVSEHVFQRLKGAGITGDYKVVDLYRQGHGTPVLSIIVINQQVKNEVTLHEPDNADVIYLQQPDEWKRIPAEVGTLDRYARISPSDENNWLADLMIDDASGLGTGFAIANPLPTSP
jgi:hypothetical protein